MFAAAMLAAASDGSIDITAGSSINANGVITLSVAPNGTHKYAISYSLTNTYTDAGHTHVQQ